MLSSIVSLLFFTMPVTTTPFQVKFINNTKGPISISFNKKDYIIGVPSSPTLSLHVNEDVPFDVNIKKLKLDSLNAVETRDDEKVLSLPHLTNISKQLVTGLNKFSLYNFEYIFFTPLEKKTHISLVPQSLLGFDPDKVLVFRIDTDQITYSLQEIKDRSPTLNCVFVNNSSRPIVCKFVDQDGDATHILICSDQKGAINIPLNKYESLLSIEEYPDYKISQNYQIACLIRAALMIANGVNESIIWSKIKSFSYAGTDIVFVAKNLAFSIFKNELKHELNIDESAMIVVDKYNKLTLQSINDIN